MREVRLVREKVERLEEIVEERLVGLEEPLEDEVAAIKRYMVSKEEGSVDWVPIEDLEKKEK